MKKYYIFLSFIIILFFGCTKEENIFGSTDLTGSKFDTLSFEHSIKGWELYSWPISNKWKYSLLVGTNRLKTIEEIYNNTIAVVGEDSLLAILNKLPNGEEILWISQKWLSQNWVDSYRTLQLPPRENQIIIKEFCEKKYINLIILE